MFAGSRTSDLSEVKTLQIQDIAQVKRIQGTENKTAYFRQLIFKTAGGSEIGRMEAQNAYTGHDDEILSEGEEIIGVQG